MSGTQVFTIIVAISAAKRTWKFSAKILRYIFKRDYLQRCGQSKKQQQEIISNELFKSPWLEMLILKAINLTIRLAGARGKKWYKQSLIRTVATRAGKEWLPTRASSSSAHHLLPVLPMSGIPEKPEKEPRCCCPRGPAFKVTETGREKQKNGGRESATGNNSMVLKTGHE